MLCAPMYGQTCDLQKHEPLHLMLCFKQTKISPAVAGIVRRRRPRSMKKDLWCLKRHAPTCGN